MMNTRIYPLLLVVIGISLSIWAYPQLPNQVPIHWNFEGQVDGYGSRLSAVLILPIVSAAVFILLLILPKLDPRKEKLQKKFKGSYAIIMNSVFFTFLLFTHALVIFSALGYPISIETVVPMGVGILFIIIGNYMQRIKSNYFVGIRTPWALQDEDVWKMTHRLGARLFIIAGSLIFHFRTSSKCLEAPSPDRFNCASSRSSLYCFLPVL
ncbi:SdpI family protein [Ectobacillus funiculus]